MSMSEIVCTTSAVTRVGRGNAEEDSLTYLEGEQPCSYTVIKMGPTSWLEEVDSVVLRGRVEATAETFLFPLPWKALLLLGDSLDSEKLFGCGTGNAVATPFAATLESFSVQEGREVQIFL